MVDTLILLVIGGLATARIATLIVHDAILDAPRDWLYRISPPAEATSGSDHAWYAMLVVDRRGRLTTGKPVPRRAGVIGRLVSCDRCVGVWVAALLVAGWVNAPEITQYIAAIAALAQLGIIANRIGD